jgi:hypothetical protein
MKRTPFNEMAWLKFDWQRTFEIEAVQDLLTHVASNTPSIPVIFEARGCNGQVKYFLGVDRQFTRIITDVFKAHGNIRFAEISPNERAPVNVANQIKITKPILSLKTDINEAVIRAGLAALLQPKNGEQVVLQIVLGQSSAPRLIPADIPDPHAGWFKVILGDVEKASAESRSVIKEKFSGYSFNAVIRIGATGSRKTGQGHILSLLSALKTLRSAGVAICSTTENTDKLNMAYIPWSFPLKLSVKELSCLLLLPAGDTELYGAASLHPKQIMPPDWYRNYLPAYDRPFAVSLDERARLSISPEDSKEHTIILGPTGSGKSTAMQKLILSDIYAGRSVLVIDPKADLVNNVLARIPKHREDDVVIIDPSAESPVGLNPLAYKNHHNPGLIADAILAVFQQVFSENWGIYSQDVLSNALHTLIKIKDSSLLWLPTLLTNEDFCRKMTANIKDRIGLEPFWEMFKNLKDSERRQMTAPSLNKLRQFLLRPGLRNILGQSNPKFDLNDLFTSRKIVLVPLNKGLIGGESAKLLGSLLVGLTWTLALSRAGLPEEKRGLVSIYIDELQDYISSISSDFSDALSQARGLGVGLTLAHQHREQLSPEIRAGVDANARNKICFGVNATDAKSMAAMAPELTPEDFMALPRYQIYTSFNQNGRNTGWISGKTLPMKPPINNPAELRKKVAAHYGKPGIEVEQEYLALLDKCRETESENNPEEVSAPIGRRKKE